LLNIILIPSCGISGAAMASSVSYTTATIILFRAFLYVSKVSWKEALIIKQVDFIYFRDLILSYKALPNRL
jgi:Na+-driven multidrug efflux pump